ncbi:SoxR reducing system RseC family protein [Papillibacter cinnamivorans]|uniref:Positive regulator of sigma(E), RseC/MucC n=1 Tax=Papillibacter cinnamivorans DSM 12816 TaxID=1122930 RepID=A0A1W1YVC1_9FIRM|nr:SoxR reducing system RseC family protein [Papillibacter cinnamivorans]SMC40165.1 positive regulator of sigma(E), RseC/MucC [Papillibacter cinnamivorans DSM 12816]
MRCSARVIRILDGGLAEVELDRSGTFEKACSSCGVSGAGRGQTARITAVNSAGAGEGARVTVECAASRFFPMFLVFIVPFACFFAGYFLCAAFTSAETARSLAAGAGFILGTAPAVLRDRKLRRSSPSGFEITEVTEA